MASRKVAIEYKNRHVSRPMLDQIVGATRRTNPDAEELIVRCPSAARTAFAAVNDYEIRVTIAVTKEE